MRSQPHNVSLSRIGRACALWLAGGTTRVVVLDHHEESANKTARDIAATGSGVALACDVTDGHAVRVAFGSLETVDVLVNSAGVDEQIALADTTAEDMRACTRST